ncbi:lipase family protein [Amycolatopsis nigrescens]|uniref:lipase family protein n=1 Tax=Amycolatopsis nigrescens TaxID=381445 RepID=UPI00035E8FD3|nr:lipase family protein [Amycolatopsis nigrescens]
MKRALFVVLVAVLTAFVATQPAPAVEPGRPGDVVSATEAPAHLLLGIPLDARAWKISYRSTTATGEPTAVTGTVLVPKAPHPGPRPLVGFAAGTQGLADRCAPSQGLALGLQYEAPLLGEMLRRGWAVALTDYPGLGTPGEHPYVVGRALGPAVLDAMRAARRLPPAGLDPAGPLAVHGYSEGGNAAGWTAQLQPSYAPDLPLAGVTVGAAPADLRGLAATHDGGPLAFLLAYAAIGFDAAYPELHLDRYFNDLGRRTVATLRDTCIVDAFLRSPILPHRIDEITTTNPLRRPDWQARLTENNLGALAPTTSVLLGNAGQDEVIPAQQGRELYRQWCALGVNAHAVDIPFGEHLTGYLSFAGPALDFLTDRLAGRPLPRAAECAQPARPGSGAGPY